MTRPAFPSWRLLGAVALLVVALLAFVAFITSNVPTARDADEASALHSALTDSRVLGSGAQAMASPGRRRTRLHVYGALDAATQDRVVAVVRAARSTLLTKPVKVEFRTARTSRVIDRGDGTRVTFYDDGELLRADSVE